MFAHAFAFWSVALPARPRAGQTIHILNVTRTTDDRHTHTHPPLSTRSRRSGVQASELTARAQSRGERESSERAYTQQQHEPSIFSAALSERGEAARRNYGAIASSSDCVWMCSGGSPPHGPAELTLQSSASVGVTPEESWPARWESVCCGCRGSVVDAHAPPPRRRAMRMVTSPMAARRIRFAAFSSETATPLITSIRSPNLSRAEASP